MINAGKEVEVAQISATIFEVGGNAPCLLGMNLALPEKTGQRAGGMQASEQTLKCGLSPVDRSN